MKKLSLLGLIAAMACAVSAYPTLTGPTGLATLPTTAIAPTGQIQLAVDWYNTSPDTTVPFRVLYGAGDNLEFGATLIFSEDDAWGIHGKYLTPLTLAGFDIAAGAQYFSADVDIAQVYVVGTRLLVDDDIPVSGTLGLNWTRVQGLDSGMRLFFGAEAQMTPDFVLAGELQTKKGSIGDASALWSLVGRYTLTDTLTLQAGLTNGPLLGANDHELFLGFAYTLGAGF